MCLARASLARLLSRTDFWFKWVRTCSSWPLFVLVSLMRVFRMHLRRSEFRGRSAIRFGGHSDVAVYGHLGVLDVEALLWFVLRHTDR